MAAQAGGGVTRYPIVEVRPGLFTLAPGYRSVDGEIEYSAAWVSDLGGVMVADHAAVLMDRTFQALERQAPREVAAAVAHPSGDCACPSNARPLLLVPPLEPDDERQ